MVPHILLLLPLLLLLLLLLLLPVYQTDVLAGADKSVDDILKRVVGTSGPNTSVIAPGETPLGKKALEKPSAISNQQGKKLAENKISTPRTAGKKSLEKPSAISKLQEEKLAKNKSSAPPTASKPLRNLLRPSLLTPKIGTRKRLTCGPSLVREHHSAGNFPQSIQ
jgi:hypothetical protein